MKRSRLLEGISLLFAASWLFSCHHGDQLPRGNEPAPQPLAAATGRAIPERAIASASPPEAPPEEVVSGTRSPPGDVGAWADSSSYRFKVSGNKRCARRTVPGGTEDGGELLALSVDVFAKYDELVVAGRDVKLESGGIILGAEIDPKSRGALRIAASTPAAQTRSDR